MIILVNFWKVEYRMLCVDVWARVYIACNAPGCDLFISRIQLLCYALTFLILIDRFAITIRGKFAIIWLFSIILQIMFYIYSYLLSVCIFLKKKLSWYKFHFSWNVYYQNNLSAFEATSKQIVLNYNRLLLGLFNRKLHIFR